MRWYRPADPNTPGQPANLVLIPGAAGNGLLIADWDGARRATGYRLRMQVAGEPKPRENPLVQNTQSTLPGLPLAKLLTAHNDAGDGPASDPATSTLS